MSVDTGVAVEVDPLSVRQGVIAGGLAGVIAALAGVLTHLLVVEVTGRSYEQLSVVSIAAATLVATLLGGLVFVMLTRRVRRPVLAFTVLAGIAAVLDTVLAAAAGQGGGFVVEAGVLHVVVATVVAVALPRIALRSDG